MGSCEERVTTRCLYNFIEQAEEKAIVESLECFFENGNQLIPLFNRVSTQLRSDNCQIVIKSPDGQNSIRRTRWRIQRADRRWICCHYGW
jgi:hypothetical protein